MAQDAVSPVKVAGRRDASARLRSQRRGRMKGCYVYIAADELVKAGYDPNGPAPFYRVWGSSRGGLFVRLYSEQ